MKVYDLNAGKYDSWFDKNKAAFLSEVSAIKKFIPKKGEGLEVGTGTGRFAALLGIRTGVDISAPMMAYAVKRGVVALKADAGALPFMDNTFDYVLLTTVICFLKNPSAALKEARRVLKPKGIIIIGFVHKDGFLGRFYRKKKSDYYKYAVFYTAVEIKNMLKKAGFLGFKITKTLSKMVSEIKQIEKPGCKKGGFTVISAVKKGDL